MGCRHSDQIPRSVERQMHGVIKQNINACLVVDIMITRNECVKSFSYSVIPELSFEPQIPFAVSCNFSLEVLNECDFVSDLRAVGCG